MLPAMMAASDKGIPMMSVTSHPPGEEANTKLKAVKTLLPCWVGTDEVLVGEELGLRLLKDLPQPKHVVSLIYAGHTGLNMRAEGFFSVMPEGTKTVKLEIGTEPEQAKDIIRSYLTDNPDVDVVYGLLTTNKYLVDIVEELGRKIGKDIFLVTGDDSPSSLEGIIRGYYLESFSQGFSIQGRLAYNIMWVYLESGGLCPVKPIMTGPIIIDKSNAEYFKKLNLDVLGEDLYKESSPWS